MTSIGSSIETLEALEHATLQIATRNHHDYVHAMAEQNLAQMLYGLSQNLEQAPFALFARLTCISLVP